MTYKRRALEAEAALERLRKVMEPATTRKHMDAIGMPMGNELPIDADYLLAVNAYQQKRTVAIRAILGMDVPL